MYLDHFGLNEPPFRITPHTDFFFAGANRGATLEALLYAITHDEGIVKVTGEVGSGKTMLCRVLMERLPKNVETIYLANPSLARDEILFAVADELKVELANDRPSRLMRALLEHLIALYAEGRRVVVLIDEAHAMPRETLEEIRLLSNLEANRHKLLQIVLFGQPELDDHLNTADLRQLMERITHTFCLEPLVRGDIERYIDFRMRAAGYRGPNVFSANAIRRIADASEGLTRRINILADKSLLAAFAENAHAVTVKEVRRAIRDSEFYRAKRNWRPFALAAAGVAGGLAIGLSAHLLLLHPAPSGAAPPSAAVTTLPAQAPAPLAQAARTPVAAAAASKELPSAVAPSANSANPAPSSTGSPPDPAIAQPGPAAQRSPDRPAEAQTAEERRKAAEPPLKSQPRERVKLAQERYAATQEWLKTTPGNFYSIQLLTAKDSELVRLEGFLLKAFKMVPREDFHVYSVKIDGVQCYRAAYGLYPSIEETRAAMRELPPLLAAQKPYYRSVERMRSQNRQ
jgi:type II secretory pathway predicted ATPase ExeA/septal ring-binding cell division protein DamX